MHICDSQADYQEYLNSMIWPCTRCLDTPCKFEHVIVYNIMHRTFLQTYVYRLAASSTTEQLIDDEHGSTDKYSEMTSSNSSNSGHHQVSIHVVHTFRKGPGSFTGVELMTLFHGVDAWDLVCSEFWTHKFYVFESIWAMVIAAYGRVIIINILPCTRWNPALESSMIWTISLKESLKVLIPSLVMMIQEQEVSVADCNWRDWGC